MKYLMAVIPNIQYATTKGREKTHAVVSAAALLTIGSAAAIQSEQETKPGNLNFAVIEPCADMQFVTDVKASRWIKFQSLVAEWRQQSAAMSSITAMAMLRPYQQIMSMGTDAIPFILSELKAEGDDPDQWFWALSTIAEANRLNPPQIREEDQGDYQRMAQVWLDWGADRDYAG